MSQRGTCTFGIGRAHTIDEGQIPRNQFHVGCSDDKRVKNLPDFFLYVYIHIQLLYYQIVTLDNLQ